MFMIRKDKKIYKDGSVKTQIRVVEGYRPGPKLPPKQRTVKDFGYLEDNQDQESFMTMVAEFDASFKKNASLRIEVPSNANMYAANNRRQNYGYKFLEAVYDSLDISGFIETYGKSAGFKGEYPARDIFKFLVLLRILRPDSKRASFRMKDNFYGMNVEFSLPDVYRSLDFYAAFSVELQRHLNEKVKRMTGRDLSYAFYDMTNYYFEIDFPDLTEDGLRKKGVSKEHRVDPIVSMGLFMDSNGLPVSMSMFPGNTSESTTLIPTMKEIKNSYGTDRIIVVADKGLNSTKNIDEIVNNGDGFVISQVLKGKKGTRYQKEMFDEAGYICNEEGTYRYKLFTEEYTGRGKDGKQEPRKRQALIYWSKKDADKARRKREEKLRKAERAVKNNVYGIKKGQDEYVKEDIVNRKTGECLENIKRVKSVNMKKAEADAMYDGYYCIITSEMEYDERKIREVYGSLWRIEQSFRILKSDLYARPVFVKKDEHISAHFLICFTALLIIRIMQHRMGKDALSAERLSSALNAATCQVLKGGIVHLDDVGGAIAFKKRRNREGEYVDTLEYTDEDEIALDYKAIQGTFGTDFYNIYPRQEVFNRFLKNIS
jgi:transposase